MTQDDEASATVQLDDRSVPARIVLTGSVGSYYSDDLFSTCLQAIERGVPGKLAPLLAMAGLTSTGAVS